MDIKVKGYLDRAENKLILAYANFSISTEEHIKIKLGISLDKTFFNDVISESYYAIFYSAKAILLTKGIKTTAPEVHKKTYEAFKEKFVDSGIIDSELLMIYEKMIVKADELLQIFKDEKWKRGHYTYKTIPQANKGPAEESINNASKFIRNIKMIIEK